KEFMKQYKGLRQAVSAPVDHPTSMALPKNHSAFLKALDKEIGAMVADGTYAKLYRKYFSTQPEPELLAAWPALKSQFPGSK
ncbi:transporter substrate-binding domain-containing protein, partial [Streptomyces sp. NPDC002920]